MTDTGEYTQADLVALLAPTLGEERATELVRGAMSAAGMSAPMSAQDATRVLEAVGRTPGFVGSVARFALARFTLKDATAAGPRKYNSASMRAVKSDVLVRSDLTELLAPTLGQEKSDEVVLQALTRLGYPAESFPTAQALAVLDHLADEGGLVAVAARFAKAHLLMRAPK